MLLFQDYFVRIPFAHCQYMEDIEKKQEQGTKIIINIYNKYFSNITDFPNKFNFLCSRHFYSYVCTFVFGSITFRILNLGSRRRQWLNLIFFLLFFVVLFPIKSNLVSVNNVLNLCRAGWIHRQTNVWVHSIIYLIISTETWISFFFCFLYFHSLMHAIWN